jgi:hypothetical protein
MTRRGKIIFNVRGLLSVRYDFTQAQLFIIYDFF